MEHERFSRRTLLRTAGAGVGAAALAGRVSADDAGDEYVVGVAPGRDVVDVRAAADSVRRELDFGAIGAAISGRFPEAAIEALRNNPNVRYVEENGRMFALEQTTPYGIERTEADTAIEAGETGDGVSVAIVDTGIDAQHETLEANLGAGYAAAGAECRTDCEGTYGGGNDIAECLEEWDDDNDHGTHCAGTVGAADDGLGVLGVAPDVTLHAVKVLQCDGSGTFDGIAEGIRWSADRGHDVQSISLGSETESSVVRDAIAYAAERGVVLVAAAGNDGPCSDCVSYPAAYDEVIAVSATDEDDDLAAFSSTGPEIELAAPGASTHSTIPRDDYAVYSGTSMACPHVSGAAATLLAAGVDPEDVRERLGAGADDVGLTDDQQGYGRLNVADSLALSDDSEEDDDGGDAGDEDTDDTDDEDTDDTDDGEDDPADVAPEIDRFDVGRRTTGRWTRADVDWAVADADSDLESVTSELLVGDEVLDRESSSVSGSTASGEHGLRSGSEPDAVRLVVVDGAGNETSETKEY